ncbi:MAG TPA: EF2563 family selenium-dependent molybdenum hydroxylase system protein [Candidatus Mailhella excrementigallinarum]|nr:EF2563 family selenium-dependent molybdenum hydroxylase system protein [Candidatus Mailhella excrementigallinarum]
MPNIADLNIVFRGAGDVASGAALRLYNAGLRRIIMLEIPRPMAVRRTVSFSEAVYDGEVTVEGVRAKLAVSSTDIPALWKEEVLPVLVDPEGLLIRNMKPDVVIEATIAKRNIGVSMADAPLVIGVGPGFTAGKDVHCVIETNRGFTMGRLYRSGSAAPNTGNPGIVMGYSVERVLRAPCSGRFETNLDIGDRVEAGASVGTVNGQPVISQIGGILRGLLRAGLDVEKGAKMGDVEPRDDIGFNRCSDKGMAVGGALLEAIIAYALNREPNCREA